MIPKYVFFTKGVGRDKDYLKSFEAALRDAGIEKCNLVTVSSIYPPNCKIISQEEGVKMIRPGQITFCVMARNSTNEPNRLVSAAIGLAVPSEANDYGYLSEYHAFGETDDEAGDYAEDIAATMLATTLGIEFDVNRAWDERKEEYIASGKIFKTRSISQSAIGDKEGQWTTVVSSAVFIVPETEVMANQNNTPMQEKVRNNSLQTEKKAELSQTQSPTTVPQSQSV